MADIDTIVHLTDGTQLRVAESIAALQAKLDAGPWALVTDSDGKDVAIRGEHVTHLAMAHLPG